MKKFIFTSLMLSVFLAGAQDFNYNYKTYSWSSELPAFAPAKTDTGFTDIILFYKQFTEFLQEDGSVKKVLLTHKLKYISDNKGVEDNNKLIFPVGMDQSLIQLRTRVVKNGKLVSEASKADLTRVQEKEQEYNIIALKGVEQGVLIETISALYIDPDLYDSDYLQFSVPMKKVEYTLIAPERLVFGMKVYNGNATVTDSISNERRFFYTSLKDIPAFNREEKYALVNANKLRIEYLLKENTATNYKNAKWPELGRVFFDRIHSDYDKNEKELGKILSKTKYESFKTEDEKIVAIENYVKSNISVEDNAPGVPLVANMVKNKYASPYDYNLLLIQLFRKAGITHEIVLSCKKDDKRFDPEFDSWAYLRNVLIYFPASKKFLDPQSVLSRLGRIDNGFLGQTGLFIRMLSVGELVSGVATIKTIPAPAAAENMDIEEYTVNFTPNLEGITIKYHREMSNYADNQLRALYYFYNEEQRKQLMEGFLQGFDKESKITGLQVKNYSLASYQEIVNPFIIEAEISSTHFNETAGEKILFKVGEIIGPQVEMFQEKARQNPVDMEFNHSYNRRIVVNIPEGYQVKGLDKLPMNLKIADKDKQLCGFVTTYELKGNVLTILNTEYYNELHFSKEFFEDFRKVINASAEFNKISLLIEKK
jgi:hypothetical protein